MAEMSDDAQVQAWISHCKSLGNRCSQCGLAWHTRACGPTHAAIAAARAAKEGNFCIHHGTHHYPHCALPTLAEAVEVIRGLLNDPEGCACGPVGPCHFHKAARDFLKRVEGR